MAFKLAIPETYTHTVTVLLPGEKVARKFDLEFVRKSQAEVESLVEKSQDKTLTDNDVCLDVVVGWESRQVTDEDGNPVEFSAAALRSLLGVYPVPAAIVTAYFDSLSGARQKN